MRISGPLRGIIVAALAAVWPLSAPAAIVERIAPSLPAGTGAPAASIGVSISLLAQDLYPAPAALSFAVFSSPVPALSPALSAAPVFPAAKSSEFPPAAGPR